MVGFLALRHALTAWLLEEGGHIGYSVRPSRRGQGHATRALGLAVRRSAELGLDRVLLTCDEDNVASARTIERNGGVYEDTRNGKRRYWIATEPQRFTSCGRKNRSTRMKSSGSTIVASTANGAIPRRGNSTFQPRLPGWPCTSTVRVLAGHVEDVPAALLDDLELALRAR